MGSEILLEGLPDVFPPTQNLLNTLQYFSRTATKVTPERNKGTNRKKWVTVILRDELESFIHSY